MSTWGDVTLVVNGEEPELSSGLLSIERAPPALRFPVLTVSGRRGRIFEVNTAAPKFCFWGRVVRRRSEKGVVKRIPPVSSSSK